MGEEMEMEMKLNNTTAIKPKCDYCEQEIDWQWTTYVKGGIIVNICKNCVKEYEGRLRVYDK